MDYIFALEGFSYFNISEVCINASLALVSKHTDVFNKVKELSEGGHYKTLNDQIHRIKIDSK